MKSSFKRFYVISVFGIAVFLHSTYSFGQYTACSSKNEIKVHTIEAARYYKPDIELSNNLQSSTSKLYTNRKMVYAFALSGLIANTNIDEQIRTSYYTNLKTSKNNRYSKIVKPLGNGRLMFSAYPTAYIAGKLFRIETLTEWSIMSSAATFISAPGLLMSQYVLGASRPHHGFGSYWWSGMDGKNGASGHTWVAAIPIITSAKMTKNKILKTLLYSASTLTGISRINDDAHYASQVLLGYAWAYYAVDSIFSTRNSKRFSVLVTSLSIGLSVNI